jgi:hypothetical protein
MDTDSEKPTDTIVDPQPLVSGEKAPPKKASRPRKPAPKAQPAKRGKARRETLPVGEMSKDELKLASALFSSSGPREGKTLHDLQKQLWPKTPGTSKVRNTIRRLVKFGWVEMQEHTKQEIAELEKAGKGRLYSKYRITEKGRKRGLI